ncbi:MAG: hypothetical protein AAF358_12915 [Pseudomonadota bacterium]
MSDISSVGALLAIEIDPTEQMPSLEPLGREQAQQLGDAMTADLAKMMPDVRSLGMALSAAVYDQTQILAPGFPVHSALTDLYRESLGSAFQPYCMALGAADGHLPKPALDPALNRLTGPLLIVPWVLTGPPEQIQAASQELEQVLVESGQASAATALALNQLFGFNLVHAQYLTSNDLAAMLSLQFANVGLPELWDLLEAALYAPDEDRWTVTDCGSRVVYMNEHVEVLFQPFDAWAASADPALEPGDLAGQYAACLRSQRQITVTLTAHGVPVRVIPVWEMPESLDRWRETRPERKPQAMHWHHVALDGPTDGPVQITQHTDPELGSVAFTVAWQDAAGELTRVEHHYPLVPQGVAPLMNKMQEIGDGERCFSYPGKLVIDATSRTLAVDPDALAPNWH